MIKIRLAEPEDIVHLPEVEKSASRAFQILADYNPDSRTVPTATLEEMAGEKKLWVASKAARLVGFVGCRDMESLLYIHEISVAYEFQKQGIGQKLMQNVIDEARCRGYRAVGLTTRRDLVWNKPFYETLLFSEISTSGEWPGLESQLRKEIAQGADPAKRCAMLRKL